MEEIIVRFRGKIVGKVVGSIYITIRTYTHFFRIYKGFGISKQVLSYIARMGVSIIKIVYIGKLGKIRIYTSRIRDWLKGETYVFNNEGYEDEQLILSVDMMSIEKDTLLRDDPLVVYLKENKEKKKAKNDLGRWLEK